MADAINPFLGMRASDDFIADARPKNWRQAILRQYPNGMAPLTALLALMKTERTDDPEFNWWEKLLASQGGAIAGVYTASDLGTPYASGGVAGDVLYVKLVLAVAKEIRVGHQILLRDADDVYNTANCDVTAKVNVDGTYDKLTVTLLETDDNGAGSNNISNSDTIQVVGSINEEGATIPDAIAYDPNKRTNLTQIFRTPLTMTRTAMKTRLRTGDQVKEARREALELHMIETEMAYIFGVKREWDGANGKPKRTTDGLITSIRARSANVADFKTATGVYGGKAWADITDGGSDWLDNQLEMLFRYGDTEKLAFCGSGALNGLNKLAKVHGQINLKVREASFGIKVTEWITPFGTLQMKTHPLFVRDLIMTNAMVIFEPRQLKYRFIDDTFLRKFYDGKSSYDTSDAIKEEYLTEAGLEFHHPTAFGYWTGVGQNNTAGG